MVQGINNLKVWSCNAPITEHGMSLIRDFPFRIPEIYMELLKKHDGVRMDYIFKYYDTYVQKQTLATMDSIFGTESEYDNLIEEYNDPAEFFPENVVPFSVTGNGDMICFDYREDPNTDNPPVVYWNHEAEETKNISFVAKDFESFLHLLEEPKD